jgi:hypothetical protein
MRAPPGSLTSCATSVGALARVLHLLPPHKVKNTRQCLALPEKQWNNKLVLPFSPLAALDAEPWDLGNSVVVLAAAGSKLAH